MTASIFLPCEVKQLVERRGLLQRARKAVEDEALGAIGLGDALGDDLDHHFVGDEPAGFHDGAGFLADRACRP